MKRNALGLAAIGAGLCLAAVPAITVTSAQAAPAAGESPHRIVAQSGAAYAGLMEQARNMASQTAKSIGLGASEGLTPRSVIVDADGATHTRYDRTFDGLPVIGGDLIVERASNGEVRNVIKNIDARVVLPKNAVVADGARARQGALNHTKNQKNVKVVKEAQAVLLNADGSATPVYAVTTTGEQANQTPSQLTSYVDANGTVVKSVDVVKEGTGNSMYSGQVSLNTLQSGSSWLLKDAHGNYTTDLKNATAGTGTQLTDADNVWGNGTTSDRATAGVDAEYGAEKTYDYYNSTLGRAGIWGTGAGARSRVHYGNNYSNAFWDGSQMTYGDGANNAKPLTSIDVAAHEMSHGVTENTANLDYGNPPAGIYYESGGLNEATSDIFGTAVEFYANSPADPGDYFIGEKLDMRGNGTPLRYMDQPSKDGKSQDCFSSQTGKVDPHYSSGPLNHWFFMASEGSGARTVAGVSYNSPTCGGAPAVTGAGRTNIEKVWYRTLATKLTTNSTYASARNGAITSAIELYGASSPVCTAVESAFNAIAVPAGTAKCGTTSTPTPTPTPTSTGGTADLVTNGGFESGQTGWTGTSGPITNDSGQAAHGGSWKLWLGGNGRTASENVSQTFTIPSTVTSAKLTYWVHIDTAESGSTAYDKSTVTVTPAGASAVTVGSFSNANAATGYVQKTADLTAYKGKSVTLKFAATEDSSLQTSFVYDDVAVATS